MTEQTHEPGDVLLTCAQCGTSEDCSVVECRTLWLSRHIGHPVRRVRLEQQQVGPSAGTDDEGEHRRRGVSAGGVAEPV